ncbi:MAG: hypothetical protein HOP35_10855 [Nitrospira sp.]|nr:hypothetical protein [Nitrospira sp.]
MHTLLHFLALPFALVAFLLPDKGVAASSPYVQTTDGLDLNRVRFAISAPPEFTSQLAQRATVLFAKAGLPPLQSDTSHMPSIATLTLTLAPQPLKNGCPGHLLYAPSLALTEPVLIPRNSVIMDNVTWLAHTGAQVRTSVTIADLEHDLEEFINQFITDYRAANAGSHSSIPGTSPATPHPGAPITAPKPLHSDSILNALPIDQLQISVSAGRFSHALTTRALQQFNDAGLALSPGQHHNGQLTLGVELIQQPLEDRCPGKVLYESGLYLVEQIQVTRNPRVSIWSDTWLYETTLVVAPRSQEQLESDQDALLRQFIDSLKTH